MLIKGMTNVDYHKTNELSSSGLSPLAKSPAHFKHERDNRKDPTPAMKKGTAFHTLTLEPENASEVAVEPVFDLRTTLGKADKKAFYNTIPKETVVLKQKDYDDVRRMVDAVHECPEAMELLVGGNAELSLFWNDPAGNAACKCRPDYLQPGVVVELKSSILSEWHYFNRDAGSRNYYQRAAFYCRGLRIETGIRHSVFKFIVCENTAPFGVKVYNLPSVFLDVAEESVERLIGLYAQCIRDDRWPGYSAIEEDLKPATYHL